VISRRLRLSFLNAQAALEALPRVIDIMAEELNWNAARRRQEMKHTTHFLQSMGLPPGTDVPAPARSSQHWYDWAYRIVGTTTTTNSHGRAQFEAGEADSLREAFLEQSRDSTGRLAKPAVRELLQGIPAYAGIRTKDFEYVLEETGLAKQEDVDMDEFVEVGITSIPPSRRLGDLLTVLGGSVMRGTQGCVVRSCVQSDCQETESRNSGREERWRCLNEGCGSGWG
jgi:glycerol-3-phosphate dehydrogenase